MLRPVNSTALPLLPPLNLVHQDERLLVADKLLQRPELFETLGQWKERLTPLPAQRFDSDGGRRRLRWRLSPSACCRGPTAPCT